MMVIWLTIEVGAQRGEITAPRKNLGTGFYITQ
jgi:hypothetical protein